MACPWFYPLERLGPARSIMPLGDVWDGQCRAPGVQGAASDRRALVECCNLGYARGKCPHFPETGPDAVRFAVTREASGAVGICCVVEKEFLPFSRTSLDYDLDRCQFVIPPPDRILERQAAAYVANYLLRKANA